MQPTRPMMRNAQSQEIDITYMARAIVRNLPLILLCAWIGLTWGFLSAQYIKAPVYQSSSYLMIRSKKNPAAMLADQTILKVASQYQKTFAGSAMKSTIREIAENPDLNGSITTTVPSGTNFLVVTATAKSPMDAFEIVQIATENVTQVSDYYITDYYLEELTKPTVPVKEANPQGSLQITLLGAFLGTALSAAIVLLINYLRTDVKNERQMDACVETERFATLFYEKKRGKNKNKGILLKYYNTGFLYAESVRKMAAKFVYQAKKNHTRVLMVTSVLENEGKSTVSGNLALALAAQNKKVLLVDGDFRHPSLYQLFEKTLIPQQEILNYLRGSVSLQEVLTKESISGLYYLFGTETFRDADQLLRSEKMKTLLASVRDQVDYVIIDTAPMMVSNDAEILSHLVDSAILVVRQGYSCVGQINDALDLLHENEVQICGCVYNAVETSVLPKAESNGYYYAYGYGDGYGYYNSQKDRG